MIEAKVSVIIPAYNAQQTIEKCINSVICQTYSNIEIIIIDDGSKDKTSEIVKKIKDERIRYFKQDNLGVSSARNKGLESADGTYCVFIDADDLIDQNLLKSMITMAENDSLDMVCCSHTEKNSTINGGNSNLAKKFIARSNSDIEQHFWDIYVGMAVGKLFRKQLIDREKIRFPMGVNLAEDFYFTASVMKATNRIGKIDNACYRVINSNPDSLSKKYISEINICIKLQLDIWHQLKEKYPQIDKIYAEKDMDYKLQKVKIYANNFYRKGSNISYHDSIKHIRAFIKENSELFKDNEKLCNVHSKMRKLETCVIKTKNAFLIGTMYYLKEHIRKIYLNHMWRHN